jgi:hypothetical protein
MSPVCCPKQAGLFASAAVRLDPRREVSIHHLKWVFPAQCLSGPACAIMAGRGLSFGRASAGEWRSAAVERQNGGHMPGSPVLTAEQRDEDRRQGDDEE